MVKTFQECFGVILTGDREASRKAARQARKLVYSSSVERSEKIEVMRAIIENAPKEYAGIKEPWRQENFVLAISVMYFLHNKREQPDFLFSWLYQLIQHSNGYIRYAAVKMFENELGPLTAHIRCPDVLKFKQRAEQSNRILCALYFALSNLAIGLWEPVYKKYKYISDLPSGQYKSVAMVLGTMEEYCGEDFFNHI